MKKILYITSGLATGGAEMMLLKLLSRLHGSTIEAGVISLFPGGDVAAKITALRIPVWHLGLDRYWKSPLALGKLAGIVRRFKPDVIQGWMYHGNLTSYLACCFASKPIRSIWGIRQSLYDLTCEKRSTRWAIRIGAILSSRPDAIVYNSEVSRRQHECFGYNGSNALIVDNGFDTERFRPDPDSINAVRHELGLSPPTMLVGLIARYHPMKGHEIFMQAAACLAARMPDVHFLLAGRDVDEMNTTLASWSDSPLLSGRVHLLGERQDVPRLTAALDVASSSSWSEGFPNILGEAMSCGVPCVSTDVGDARRIIGATGTIIPAGDVHGLACAWEKLLSQPRSARQNLGGRARRRIEEFFSIDEIAARYDELYQRVCDEKCESAMSENLAV